MTTVEAPATQPGDLPPADVPLPLENGDRLTRAEFERRYAAMPHLKKAELVEGEVIMPSPTRLKSHSKPHGDMATWLGVYCASTPGVELADNATVRLDADNEVQPDLLLRLERGGKTRVSDDDFVEGPPEFIVEIAASSASYDRHAKLNIYRRTGVQEYVIWQVHDRKVEWFELREGAYAALNPDEAGVFHSRVFPGLWLNAAPLLENRLAEVLAELQRGLTSEEHHAFAARLKGA
ncbi:MAG TPA: Uma2 family endonuclease, partial [Anaerolineales bacterium]|nr:Uma2 family endonuclease [Anaerolineales bacterium]